MQSIIVFDSSSTSPILQHPDYFLPYFFDDFNKQLLQIRRKSQLVCETHCKLRMLQHVFVVHRRQGILARVDVRAVIFEAALEDECAWIAVAVRGRMVGATIAALGAHVADVAVLPRVRFLSSAATDVPNLSKYAVCRKQQEWKARLTASITFVINSVRPASTLSVMTPTTSGLP